MDMTFHVSPGVSKKIPPEIQFLVWFVLKKAIENAPLQKYLQIFLLTKNGQGVQQIRYWPESQTSTVDYTFPVLTPVNAEVFILCGEKSYTMILRKELECDPYE